MAFYGETELPPGVCECVSCNGLVTCSVTAAMDSRSLETLIRQQDGRQRSPALSSRLLEDVARLQLLYVAVCHRENGASSPKWCFHNVNLSMFP